MTTYDALGLPIFDATDKIAAGDDGLRQDLNLIGATARTAIIAEGVRSEGAAVASAAGYTDTKDTSNRAAWATADTAKLNEAKSYADTKKAEAIGTAAADATTKANTAQTTAKSYADALVATDRGRLNVIEDTAVFDGDGRLLKLEEMDEISFGVEDDMGRRLWIEANKAGKPTAYSSGLIGEAIGYQTVPVDGHSFAVVDSQDRIVFAPNRAHPVADWAHWGDSMTDDEVTGLDSWTVQLSALTGRHHFNGGWYQQKSDQIAARMGALPALVTVTGNATAASGGTVVTSIINSPVLYSGTRYVRGTLAGIPGSLQQTYTDIVLFYPDTPGVFPIPPKSRFTPADGLALRDRHLTIWTGRNDVYSTDPQLVVAAVQQMVEYVSSDVKRVLVFDVPPSTADGGSGKPLTLAINTALKAAFPAYWLPVSAWLRTPEAATAAGITFTAQDNTDITNGDTPESFRMDSVHLNATGCKAVAFRVHQEAQKRGWL